MLDDHTPPIMDEVLGTLSHFRIQRTQLEFLDSPSDRLLLGGCAEVRPARLNPRESVEPHGTQFSALHPHKKVAVKLASRFDEKSTRLMVVRETYVLSMVKNPHIVDFMGFCIDFETSDGWLITSWEPLGNLKGYLDRNKGLTVAKKLQLLHDTLNALTYLHNLDSPIYHGDIKAVNVLVTQNHRAMLCDFGLARVVGDSKFERLGKSDIQTTLRWRSPELLEDEDHPRSWASDMWAWGWLVWEVFTESIPFEKLGQMAVIRAISMYNLPAIDEHPSLGCVPLLSSVLRLCLTYEPEARPTASNSAEMLLEIMGAPASLPVQLAFTLPDTITSEEQIRTPSVVQVGLTSPPVQPADTDKAVNSAGVDQVQLTNRDPAREHQDDHRPSTRNVRSVTVFRRWLQAIPGALLVILKVLAAILIAPFALVIWGASAITTGKSGNNSDHDTAVIKMETGVTQLNAAVQEGTEGTAQTAADRTLSVRQHRSLRRSAHSPQASHPSISPPVHALPSPPFTELDAGRESGAITERPHPAQTNGAYVVAKRRQGATSGVPDQALPAHNVPSTNRRPSMPNPTGDVARAQEREQQGREKQELERRGQDREERERPEQQTKKQDREERDRDRDQERRTREQQEMDIHYGADDTPGVSSHSTRPGKARQSLSRPNEGHDLTSSTWSTRVEAPSTALSSAETFRQSAPITQNDLRSGETNERTTSKTITQVPLSIPEPSKAHPTTSNSSADTVQALPQKARALNRTVPSAIPTTRTTNAIPSVERAPVPVTAEEDDEPFLAPGLEFLLKLGEEEDSPFAPQETLATSKLANVASNVRRDRQSPTPHNKGSSVSASQDLKQARPKSEPGKQSCDIAPISETTGSGGGQSSPQPTKGPVGAWGAKKGPFVEVLERTGDLPIEPVKRPAQSHPSQEPPPPAINSSSPSSQRRRGRNRGRKSRPAVSKPPETPPPIVSESALPDDLEIFQSSPNAVQDLNELDEAPLIPMPPDPTPRHWQDLQPPAHQSEDFPRSVAQRSSQARPYTEPVRQLTIPDDSLPRLKLSPQQASSPVMSSSQSPQHSASTVAQSTPQPTKAATGAWDVDKSSIAAVPQTPGGQTDQPAEHAVQLQSLRKRSESARPSSPSPSREPPIPPFATGGRPGILPLEREVVPRQEHERQDEYQQDECQQRQEQEQEQERQQKEEQQLEGLERQERVQQEKEQEWHKREEHQLLQRQRKSEEQKRQEQERREREQQLRETQQRDRERRQQDEQALKRQRQLEKQEHQQQTGKAQKMITLGSAHDASEVYRSPTLQAEAAARGSPFQTPKHPIPTTPQNSSGATKPSIAKNTGDQPVQPTKDSARSHASQLLQSPSFPPSAPEREPKYRPTSAVQPSVSVQSKPPERPSLASPSEPPVIVQRPIQANLEDAVNVKEYLARNPLVDRRLLTIQVATAVARLHAKLPVVIHVNLSPSKVLVSDKGEVVLSNFESTERPKDSDADLLAGNDALRLLRYTAPEILQDQNPSQKSDVYAFGCVALEIITSRHPYFELNATSRIVSAILKGTPSNPTAYPGLVSDSPLWTLFRKCWALDPDQRPTMQEVHDELVLLK